MMEKINQIKSKVYIETSIVSYVSSRLSKDLIVAAQQQITHNWWDSRRNNYALFVSELVIEEASRGDKEAAERRLSLISEINVLAVNENAVYLAEQFLKNNCLTHKAESDALHIAIATVHKVDYLLTWNCRHIANAEIQKKLMKVSQKENYELPILCTPNELMGKNNDDME